MAKRKFLSVVAAPALASVLLGGLPAVAGYGAVARNGGRTVHGRTVAARWRWQVGGGRLAGGTVVEAARWAAALRPAARRPAAQ